MCFAKNFDYDQDSLDIPGRPQDVLDIAFQPALGLINLASCHR